MSTGDNFFPKFFPDIKFLQKSPFFERPRDFPLKEIFFHQKPSLPGEHARKNEIQKSSKIDFFGVF